MQLLFRRVLCWLRWCQRLKFFQLSIHQTNFFLSSFETLMMIILEVFWTIEISLCNAQNFGEVFVRPFWVCYFQLYNSINICPTTHPTEQFHRLTLLVKFGWCLKFYSVELFERHWIKINSFEGDCPKLKKKYWILLDTSFFNGLKLIICLQCTSLILFRTGASRNVSHYRLRIWLQPEHRISERFWKLFLGNSLNHPV